MAGNKGYFITLEGGEGAGKSSLLKSLAAYLEQRGYEVVQTREPGGSSLGETIRHWLLVNQDSDPIGHQAELLLFLAARSQHIEELIRPALAAGKIVLCDRFNDSTIAYQGAARGLDNKYVEQLCRLVCGEIEPQLTLFLDVDPEIGLQRTRLLTKEQAAAGQLDRIEVEALGFHQSVQKAFQALAKHNSQRICRLNANFPQEEVFKEAVRLIEERLSCL